MNTTHKMVGHN